MTHRTDIAAAAGDTHEHRSTDDRATNTEAQLLAIALAQLAERGGANRSVPGVCSYCAEQCLPRAVYCDADCRADHERELTRLARQGVGR